MNREGFFKVLAGQLYPVLRGEGFRGSGTTLRRIEPPVVHVVNLQGSSTGLGCYINLGAHLTFLPSAGGGSVLPSKLTESHCSFRDRLEPPGGQHGRWPYGDTSADAVRIAESIVRAYGSGGRQFFARHGAYPQAFAGLIGQAVVEPPHPAHALVLAWTAIHLGLVDEARLLAERGLRDASERATSLKTQLRRILEGGALTMQ